MDSNRDDARRCLDLARSALSAGDVQKATRLLDKSRRMYPLPDEQTTLQNAIRNATSTSTSSRQQTPSSSKCTDDKRKATKSSSASSSASSSTSSTTSPNTPPRPATPEMIADVRAVSAAAKKSHYDVLAIPRDADEAAIKKAYRRLALRLHPDRNFAQGADEAFKRVSQAFVTLSDASRRAHYDQFGTDDASQTLPTPRRRAGGGDAFEQFVFMNGDGVSADELFNFLFANATGAHTMHARFTTPRRRRTGTGGNDSGAEDGEGRRRQQRQFRRRDGGVEGEDVDMSFWERIRPIAYMFLVLFLVSLLSSDPDGRIPSFSLEQSRAHGVGRMTGNGVPFFVRGEDVARGGGEGGGRQLRALWRVVDRQALERYRQSCQVEQERVQYLEYQASSWFNGRKARESYRRQADSFSMPWCGRFRHLLHLIQRNG